MANVDRPRGFVPVKDLNGSPWNGAVNPYLCEASNAIYVGDVVYLTGDSGDAGVVVNGIDVEGIATIDRVTTVTDVTQKPVGVVVGFLPLATNLALNYKAADATKRIALVADDPNTIFEVQEDADTTPIAAASIGLLTDYTLTAGNTATGLSGMELDSNAVATTVTLTVRVLGLSKRPDNAFNTAGAGSDNAKFLVKFNVHAYAPNVIGF